MLQVELVYTAIVGRTKIDQILETNTFIMNLERGLGYSPKIIPFESSTIHKESYYLLFGGDSIVNEIILTLPLELRRNVILMQCTFTQIIASAINGQFAGFTELRDFYSGIGMMYGQREVILESTSMVMSERTPFLNTDYTPFFNPKGGTLTKLMLDYLQAYDVYYSIK